MVGPQVDIALVEAGLGGARDATNVFEPAHLKATILTAVGLEHQAALGEGDAPHDGRTSTPGVLAASRRHQAAVPRFEHREAAEPSRSLGCCAGAGGSLASIAAAKAGIMKAGCPVVLGSQPHPDAKRVLCRRAKELRCRWA